MKVIDVVANAEALAVVALEDKKSKFRSKLVMDCLEKGICIIVEDGYRCLAIPPKGSKRQPEFWACTAYVCPRIVEDEKS